MKPVRVTLLGLDDQGAHLCDALAAEPAVELWAVAHGAGPLAGDRGEALAVQAFDDYRRAIVESAAAEVDAMFLALPAFEAEEYLPLCAQYKLPVFVVPPIARQFDASVEILKLFSQGDGPLVVARPWAYGLGSAKLSAVQDLAGRIVTVLGQATQHVPAELGWRGDAKRAGGGALLYAGYGLVDAVVTLLGLPDLVFAAGGWNIPPDQARPADTEDAASVVFGFADDRSAAINCRRADEPADWSLKLFGTQATLTLGPHGLTRDDGPAFEQAVEIQSVNCFSPAVEAFISELGTELGRVDLPEADSMPTLATLRAAYLSIRTGSAESPQRVLELAGLVPR